MRRLQWTLILLATGLTLSVALLAGRALQGVAFEKAARHETVATRVFDEMERALSRFLDREEARPFDSWEPGRSDSLAEDSFVVGYFQIEPDGSVRGRASSTAADPRAAKNQPTLNAIVGKVWSKQDRDVAELREAEPPVAFAERPAPGKTKRVTTQPVAAKKVGAKDAVLVAQSPRYEDLAIEPKTGEEQGEASAYRVLQAFNSRSADRSDRQRKVEIAKSRASALEYASAPALAASPRPDPARRARPAASSAGREAGGLVSASLLESIASAPIDELEADDAFEERALRLFDAEAPSTLDPLIGRPSGPDHLLLYRTVVMNARGYRQGLVVDRVKLGRWLEQRVLAAATELSNSSDFWFFGSGQPVRYDAPATWLAYEHRFAEPFDAFSVVLTLAPLPGVATTGTIYLLVALVLGVATLGLFAVYRMAFVTLRYAERRNNFVSAVSHELKTPLTAIRMYGEMLRDGVATDEAKRRSYYETITDESERLSRLINNVLEFSKIERGGAETALTVGAIAPVLDEAIQTLRPHAEREGFALRLEIDDDLPALRFDRDAVVQLLFNLVDNALKYAHNAAQKEVVVTCRRAGEGVRLSVRDFGPGVARPHLSQVFEPFYRGENEMTRSTRGTGIGLALVKDLAERMGAAASASNAQGGGFEVSVQFRAG